MEHEAYFRNNPLSKQDFALFQQQSAKSIRQQQQIESNDSIPFTQYLADYFEEKPC